MEKLFIGSKFFGHDSAIFAIFPDTKEVFSLDTGRITRYKHDFLYASIAIEKMLKYKKIDPNKIKKVYLGNSPLSAKEEYVSNDLHELQLAYRRYYNICYINEFKNKLADEKKKNVYLRIIKFLFSRDGRKILSDIIINKLGLKKKEFVDSIIKKYCKKIFPNADIEVRYYDHQFCHAMASWFFSPFDDAIFFTSDGWGDDKFSAVYLLKNNEISLFAYSNGSEKDYNIEEKKVRLGMSVGGIFGYFTELLGFLSGSDEGKVEALAAYGSWNNEIYRTLLKYTRINKNKKSIEIEWNEMEKFLDYRNIQKYIKSYKREDIAAAAQKYLEDIHLQYLKFIINETGIKNICFSGGVAANVILNLRIYEEITNNLYITPAMSDNGTAQGAAINLLLDNDYNSKDLKWLRKMEMPYFSTSYTKSEILQFLKDNNCSNYIDLGSSWPEKVAERIAAGEIGAIFHGRMEWGPRALGNRSILANPKQKEIRKIINVSIKNRPEFQPFCPSILAEEKDRLFKDAYLNKHMTCAFRMKDEYAAELPGAVHIDNTCRAQFVEKKDNPNYYRILQRIKDLTGYGVVINTSFNKHGRTIVESPGDAITDFFDTNLDFLIIEGILIEKND